MGHEIGSVKEQKSVFECCIILKPEDATLKIGKSFLVTLLRLALQAHHEQHDSLTHKCSHVKSERYRVQNEIFHIEILLPLV